MSGVKLNSLDTSGKTGFPTHRPLSTTEENTQGIAEQILGKNFPPSEATLEPERVVAYDPASETIQAGALFEERSTKELKAMESESNQIIEAIDLLLDLSREIATLNAESPKLTQKIKDINRQLQDRGINLLNIEEGKEIDKEQLAALKTATGSHIDKLRTKIQQIFTKMQTVIQNMSSVNDSIKKMISEQSDLIRKILERSIKH
jgi:hypothetical protein